MLAEYCMFNDLKSGRHDDDYRPVRQSRTRKPTVRYKGDLAEMPLLLPWPERRHYQVGVVRINTRAVSGLLQNTSCITEAPTMNAIRNKLRKCCNTSLGLHFLTC